MPASSRRHSMRRSVCATQQGADAMGAKHFGARVTRLEDPALLSGRGRFVDDVKMSGVLHACFVRSPYAHARVHGIDGKAALAIPGVHAVIAANDLPDPMRSEAMPMLLPNPSISALCTQHVLARAEVYYVGQPVAVVIADSRYIAEDAAAAVAVHYDALPAVGDCRDAVEDDAPRAHAALGSNVLSTFQLAYGDVDAAFASAPHIFEDELWQHRGGGMAIETRAVLASHDAATDMLTVWSGTQTPHICRRMLADLLGRELESIRMIAPDVGGGFGPKAIFYPEEAVIPAAALKLGRPVKWIEDRGKDFRRTRTDAARFRRLRAVGHHHALHRRGHRAGPLRDPGLSARHHGGAHQQGADDTGARRRPAAGGVRHGAVARPRRPRATARSRRGAPAQFHSARADAL